jgi:alkaline phosphatase D
MRSYRGPNTANDQAAPGPDTAFLGTAQIRWLKEALLASNATWKVIAADMPIGLIVPDGELFENLANGDGPPRGRELEIADLLRFIRDNRIANVVWLTADVHYTAAHRYDPDRAQFQDFAPFWEFVSGPLNAGTFGPNQLDDTFGPQVVFQKAPPEGQANLPPSAGLQFFGQVDIDGASEVMTVRLKDLSGATLFTQVLEPQRPG